MKAIKTARQRLQNRLVDFSVVGWMWRAAKAAGLIVIMSACFITAAVAETRTLKLYNTHTKERVSITFKKNGRYLPAGLREANRFLRDWRRNEIIKIDPELLDLVWEVYQQVRAKDYIYVVSSYRSPATNNMLRKRSRGVARNSQHTLGKAMDFYIPGVNLAKLRATGLRKQVGGVGYYPRSGSPFVHMDTGSVRHWPKMSRSQLAKVFPDGKTLHIPSDGKPLKGYKIALAESKSGKRRTSKPTLVADSRPRPSSNAPSTRDQSLTAPGKPILSSPASSTPAAPAPRTAKRKETKQPAGGNLFAGLFGGGQTRDRNQANRAGAVGNAAPAQTADASLTFDNPPVPARKVPASGASPVPPAPLVVASADTTGAQAQSPVPAGTRLTPPGPTPPATVGSTPAANTLDAQRFALENGQPVFRPQPVANPATPNEAIDSRFQIAAAPALKPKHGLSDAAKLAAAELGITDAAAGSVPVPRTPPANDPVAAIAAATGAGTPSPAPAPRPETTLAYASASAIPASLTSALRPAASLNRSEAAVRPGAASEPARGASRQPSLSGRIPSEEILDPMAGFARLPDKSEPSLLSGAGTTRHKAFALLSHPNQRALKNVIMPGNRFVASSFAAAPYGTLRADRFAGPAVVILPVRYAR